MSMNTTLTSDEIPRLLGRLQKKRSRRIALSFPAGGAAAVAICMAFIKLSRNLNIHYDEYHGSSAGAGFAAALGLGISYTALEEFCYMGSQFKHFRDFDWRGIALSMLRRKPLHGLIHGKQFENQLKRIYSGRRFQDCIRDTFLYVEREDTHTLKTFSNYTTPNLQMHSAVRASAAIHGWMKPKNLGGVNYLDGGILDHSPLKQIYLLHKHRFGNKKLTIILLCSEDISNNEMTGNSGLIGRMKNSFYTKPRMRRFEEEYFETNGLKNVEIFLFYPTVKTESKTLGFKSLSQQIDLLQPELKEQFLKYDQTRSHFWQR